MHMYYTILNWHVFVFWWTSPRHCFTFMICSLDSQNKKRTCLREKTWSIHIRRRCPDPGTPQLQYWKRWQYFTANIGSEGSRSHLRSKSVQESWGRPFGKYDIFAETLQAEIMRWCTKIDKYQVWAKLRRTVWQIWHFCAQKTAATVGTQQFATCLFGLEVRGGRLLPS